MKGVVVILLVLIVASLGKALMAMTAGPERARAVARALTFRIGLSVALFVLLMVGDHFGWITAH